MEKPNIILDLRNEIYGTKFTTAISFLYKEPSSGNHAV